MASATRKQSQTKVRFTCRTPDARAVCLAGAFNQWNPRSTPMKRSADGEWFVELPLSPGRYEYKFIVDGQWCCEPGQPDEFRAMSDCVCNEHGTMNRVIDVR
jgi:1,4-alpha-glucan branching enzyme